MAHGDKRSVSTDALETLGTIIGPDEKRDAIHLAVLPAVAGHLLPPGTHVILHADGKAHHAFDKGKGIGIVDPFLLENVREGERFWLVIYPRKITSLRHVWTHPDVPETEEVTKAMAPARSASEQWLRTWVASNDLPDYDRVIEAALDADGSSVFLGDYDSSAVIPGEFWDHLEVVSGRQFPATERPEYFSCAC
jgi:hypothetical protein